MIKKAMILLFKETNSIGNTIKITADAIHEGDMEPMDKILNGAIILGLSLYTWLLLIGVIVTLPLFIIASIFKKIQKILNV